jgi:hypothetical protein
MLGNTKRCLSKCAFSERIEHFVQKKWSETSRMQRQCWVRRQKHGLYLRVFSSVQHIQRRSGILHSRWIRRVKRCVSGNNTVFEKIQLCWGILNIILKNFINSGTRPCLLLMWKMNYKISCRCLFKLVLTVSIDTASAFFERGDGRVPYILNHKRV